MDNGGGGGIVVLLVELVLAVVMIASMWKVFAKAGEPGWAAIVPIYNVIVLAKIAGKPVLWGILALIPCVNIVIMFLLCGRIAQSFGKTPGFGIGLFLLGIVFWPMLAFSDATYQGPPPA